MYKRLTSNPWKVSDCLLVCLQKSDSKIYFLLLFLVATIKTINELRSYLQSVWLCFEMHSLWEIPPPYFENKGKHPSVSCLPCSWIHKPPPFGSSVRVTSREEMRCSDLKSCLRNWPSLLTHRSIKYRIVKELCPGFNKYSWNFQIHLIYESTFDIKTSEINGN